jgi:hypothetical protein
MQMKDIDPVAAARGLEPLVTTLRGLRGDA